MDAIRAPTGQSLRLLAPAHTLIQRTNVNRTLRLGELGHAVKIERLEVLVDEPQAPVSYHTPIQFNTHALTTTASLRHKGSAYRSTSNGSGRRAGTGAGGGAATSTSLSGGGSNARHRRTWMGSDADPKPSWQCGHTAIDRRTGANTATGADVRRASSARWFSSSMSQSVSRSAFGEWICDQNRSKLEQ